MNPNESLEVGPGLFKRLDECTASDIEAGIRLIAQARIDRAWLKEQADGPDRGDLTVARRFFAHTTASERALIAYWQMIKLIEQERLHDDSADDAP